MRKAIVSITFDDGLRCQFERALPIVDKHNLSSTFFLIANTDPIHAREYPHPDWRKIDWRTDDIEVLKSMAGRGHEIGAHSLTHRRSELDRDPKHEAGGSRQWIERRLGCPVRSYCYPFSYVTAPIKRAVINAGYEQARGEPSNTYYPFDAPVDLFDVHCRHIGKENPHIVDGLQIGRDGVERVEDWARAGRWHILMFHAIGTINDGWWPISVHEFTRQMVQLAKLRDSGEVEVLTFKDGADVLRRRSLEQP